MPAGSRGWRARRGEGASPASGRSERRPLCRQRRHGSQHPPHGVKHLEVADTERARIELSPVSVHRTDKEDSVGSEHATGLINKSAGVLQIVDRLVEEDYIEAPLAEGQVFSVETDEREAGPVMTTSHRK